VENRERWRTVNDEYKRHIDSRVRGEQRRFEKINNGKNRRTEEKGKRKGRK
jgi:hypothetical protein